MTAEAGDYVYVSGYSLLHAGKAQALLDWTLALPDAINVVFDPGPLVESPDLALMRALLPRIDVWTSNSVEALRFTGAADIGAALDRLAKHLPQDVLLVVRDGPQGCWIQQAGERRHVPGFAVNAVDSNGAGDAHAGVFVAGLAQGLDAHEAARRANAAAALAVTRWGPATAPGRLKWMVLSASPAATDLTLSLASQLPQVYRVKRKFVYPGVTVGAGLPAIRPSASKQISARFAQRRNQLILAHRRTPGDILRPRLFLRLSTVCVSRDALLSRACPARLATARRDDSLRSSDLALAGFLRPEPPAFSPPPDCLLTVAQARASASSLDRPLCS